MKNPLSNVFPHELKLCNQLCLFLLIMNKFIFFKCKAVIIQPLRYLRALFCCEIKVCKFNERKIYY